METIKTDLIEMINRKHMDMLNENSSIRERKRKAERKAKIMQKVKETIALLVFGTVLFAMIILALKSKANAQVPCVYSMRGELQGNAVVLEDGNIHEVDEMYKNYSSQAWDVTVVLNDNGTDDPTDDKILNIY